MEQPSLRSMFSAAKKPQKNYSIGRHQVPTDVVNRIKKTRKTRCHMSCARFAFCPARKWLFYKQHVSWHHPSSHGILASRKKIILDGHDSHLDVDALTL